MSEDNVTRLRTQPRMRHIGSACQNVVSMTAQAMIERACAEGRKSPSLEKALWHTSMFVHAMRDAVSADEELQSTLKEFRSKSGGCPMLERTIDNCRERYKIALAGAEEHYPDVPVVWLSILNVALPTPPEAA